MRFTSAILTATLLLAGALAPPADAAESPTRKSATPHAAASSTGTPGMLVVLRKRLYADASKPAPAPVRKAKEASCDVVEFHATKSGTKSVDAGLARWKAELDQPPLSAFDTFKVTGQKTLAIAQGAAGNVKVTANLGVLFKALVNENAKDRLQLEVTIDNASGKRMYRSTTTQDSGASQILSAGKSGDANVFFVVTCSAQ
jgi:hypothetical protein